MRKTLVMSSKGQITLPAELRENLGLETGDQMVFTIVNGDIVITPKSVNFNDLAGMLGTPPGGSATLEQIDDSVAKTAGSNVLNSSMDIEDDAA